MLKSKIIAFYLPQYYEFKENDEWWGKGFTEWTNVKNGMPCFRGHYQPVVPYNKNYYCLNDIKTFEWQIDLAKANGIYGFCFYHYYFGNGKKLMEKPIELFLNNRNLDLPFCLCWANHNWTRTWTGGDSEILMEVKYGDEREMRIHFDYLLQYFLDERYIKIDDKPVFVIYMPELIPNLKKLKQKFSDWCVENGMKGVNFVSQAPNVAMDQNAYKDQIDYSILYEPNYTQQYITKKIKDRKPFEGFLSSPSTYIHVLTNALKKKIVRVEIFRKCDKLKLDVFSYDGTWRAILNRKKTKGHYWLGAFVGFDNSPRKQYRGMIYKGKTPFKFKKYMKKLMEKNEKEYDKGFIFMMAWNEWGEGAYLEPDEKEGFAYLDAIRILNME